MGILYLILSVILIIFFILTKKSENKQDIVKWTILSIIVYLAYNVFVAYVLSFVHIPCNLISYSIINLLLIGVMGYFIIVKKEVQKYYLNKVDVVIVSIIFILTTFVCSKEFDFPFRIKYNTTDPSVHYMAAKKFYEYETLLNSVENDTLYDFNTFMPAAYVNTGLLFHTFDFCMDKLDFYKIYIACDIIALFLAGALFYIAVSAFARKKKSFYIIAIILALCYALGFPLSSMIYGFQYLSLGTIFAAAIIIAIKLLEEKEVNARWCKFILAMFTFGLFFSYYLFVPPVYAAIGLYFLWIYRKPKTFFSKMSIITIIETLVIPFILGFIYFLLPCFLGKGENYGNALTAEGAIYRILYGNFVLFMPLVFHYIFTSIRDKKVRFENILFIVMLMYMLFMFVLGMKGYVSSYYYYKNNYLLWLIIIYIVACELKYLAKRDVLIPAAFLITYLAVITMNLTDFSTKVYNRYSIWGNDKTASNLTDIYLFGRDRIKKENTAFTDEEMQIIKYLCNETDGKDSVYIAGDYLEQLWFYAITENFNHTELIDAYEENYIDLDAWNNKQRKYLIYFNSNNYFEIHKTEILKDAEVVFENEYGGIVKNN